MTLCPNGAKMKSDSKKPL